jgi:hypothetical protein
MLILPQLIDFAHFNFLDLSILCDFAVILLFTSLFCYCGPFFVDYVVDIIGYLNKFNYWSEIKYTTLKCLIKFNILWMP